MCKYNNMLGKKKFVTKWCYFNAQIGSIAVY